MTTKDFASHSILAARETGELMATRLLLALKLVKGDIPTVFKNTGVNCSLDEFLGGQIHVVSAETLMRICSWSASRLLVLATERDGRPSFRSEDWRLLFYCLISARSLREAIQRGSEFFRAIDGRCGFMVLHEESDKAEIRFSCAHLQRSEASFFVDMFGIANMHGIFSWLIGQPLPVLEVLMDYGSEMQPYFDRDVLPFPVNLDTPVSALRFPAQFLDFPIVRTNEDCDARTSFSFVFNMPEANSQVAFAERVRGLMHRMLRENNSPPSLQELSAKFGLNQTTFRRYLKAAGMSYNQIKDSCRREWGLNLLRRSSLSIEEISDRLGFCDSDAFRRAFHNWFDISPSQYRKQGSIDQLTQ